MMLTVNRISKSYGVETVLSEVSFTLNAGERLGLVGPNGCGKSTLLRILTGHERADAGVFCVDPPDLEIGYLPQGLQPDPEASFGDYLAQQGANFDQLQQRLEDLAGQLAHQPDEAALRQEYDQVLARLASTAQESGDTNATLAALGMKDIPLDTPVRRLSGGQKTRLALASVLLSKPRLLLLDEPTNHLDLHMLVWLENWLADFAGGVLIVSHDRALLDNLATGILELDERTHRLRAYPGNYTAYLEAKVAEHERQWQAYREQQKEIDGLEHAISRVRSNAAFKKGGKGDSGDKFAKGFFANRTKGTVARAKHLERRLEGLLGNQAVDKPEQTWKMKLEFGEIDSTGREALRLEDLSIGYGDKVLLAGLNLYTRTGERIALVGPNGSGKTTLLRTIAGLLPPLSGRVYKAPSVRVGYMAQEQEDLPSEMDAYSIIRSLAPFSETEARAFLHKFLFAGDEVFTPVGKLSYGERARLSLARLAAQECNLLLLDEPVNHLDIPSRRRFESALERFKGTVLVAVHDRYFIEGFAGIVWEITDGTIRVVHRTFLVR